MLLVMCSKLKVNIRKLEIYGSMRSFLVEEKWIEGRVFVRDLNKPEIFKLLPERQ